MQIAPKHFSDGINWRHAHPLRGVDNSGRYIGRQWGWIDLDKLDRASITGNSADMSASLDPVEKVVDIAYRREPHSSAHVVEAWQEAVFRSVGADEPQQFSLAAGKPCHPTLPRAVAFLKWLAWVTVLSVIGFGTVLGVVVNG